MEFIVYTDGGCFKNKRGAGCPGGYGYIILDPSQTIIKKGGGFRINVTNNQMELLGAIEGLRALIKELNSAYGGAKQHECVIKLDSEYVAENYHYYLSSWKKNGWRKSNNKPVLNVEFWKKLDGIAPEFKSFQFKWVKGHARDRFNNFADAIVQTQIEKAKQSLITNYLFPRS